MTTHKEALKEAYDVFCDMRLDDEYSDMEAAIRAYLETRGFVMVPKEPTLAMQGAALQYVTKQKQTRDVYRAMISAALKEE